MYRFNTAEFYGSNNLKKYLLSFVPNILNKFGGRSTITIKLLKTRVRLLQLVK